MSDENHLGRNSRFPVERQVLVMSMLRDFGQYLRAIYHTFVALVSGVASVVLLVLVAFCGDSCGFLQDKKKTFILTAIICLIVAGFSAWRKEHQKLERFERLMEDPFPLHDLEKLLKDLHSDAQVQAVASPFMGKWISVSERIQNIVDPSVSAPATVILDREFPSATVSLQFDDEWIRYLSAVPHAKPIDVRGQLKYVGLHRVTLTNCEIFVDRRTTKPVSSLRSD